jgi:hypothetical protein
MNETIKCPNCDELFELSEAISYDIEKRIKKKHEIEIEEKRKAFEEKAKKDAYESVTLELSDLREQLEEKTTNLKEARKQELELLKKQRELQEKEENQELELTRKLEEGRQKILEKATGEFEEKHRLKDAEKEKQLNDMKKQIDELKRKSEQGSQQTQGEVLELDLENILKKSFTHDNIEPVPKGIKGADVLHKVHSPSGQFCGTIVWETKRTKAWSDKWIAKIKEDQRRVKGEIAVILTTVLPKDVRSFAHINGIWVTDYSSMVELATAIRMGLIEVAKTKQAAVGKKGKMEVVYNYLSGSDFKQKVEAIVETFRDMKDDLEKEKKASTKHWAKRQKQLELVIANTAGMYGDIHGIIGKSLPEIKLLEIDSENEDDDIVLD